MWKWICYKSKEKIRNKFWIDVYDLWIELQEKCVPKNWEEYIKQPLWYNKDIQMGNKCIFIESWYEKGILHVNDLLDSDGTFLKMNEFELQNNIRVNFLTYQGIIKSISNDMRKKKIETKPRKAENPIIPQNLKIITTTKGASAMYKVLSKRDVTPTGINRWIEIFDINRDEWKKFYSSIERFHMYKNEMVSVSYQ